MRYYRPQGSSFMICCICDREFLGSDAMAIGHPDDESTTLCYRCCDELSQSEIQEMCQDAWRDARLSESYFDEEDGIS